ncbi:MAG: T9SS type A sorting domain-containing protein [Fidelibacterota bacterium]
MRTPFLLFYLFICSCMVYAQIRNDFMLSDSAGSACVKVDVNGKLHTTWNRNGIYYQLLDSLGFPITEPKNISYDNFTANPSGIAVNEEYVVVTWRRHSFSFNSFIMSQLLALNGDTISGNVMFNDNYFDAERFNPDVTFLTDTTLIVVWNGDGPVGKAVYGQISSDLLMHVGGNLVLSDLNTTDRVEQRDISVTLSRVASNDESPNFIVVWMDDRLGSDKVFGRLFSKDGTPLDSSFIISENPDFNSACCPSVIMNPNGEFTIVFNAEFTNLEKNIYLRRFNMYGTPLGNSVRINMDSTYVVSFSDIATDNDGNTIVIWEHEETYSTPGYLLAQRFSPDNEFVGKNYRVSTRDSLRDQIFPSVDIKNNKIYTAWTTLETGWDTIWVNIIDFNNPPVSINEEIINIPSKFKLYQNFPNPFNGSTIIKYDIFKQSHVKLTIYNILGNEIIVLVDKKFIHGSYKINWDGKNNTGYEMASGIYILELIIDSHKNFIKLMLIR